MHSREHMIRAMWTLFEPIHSVSYFSAQARDAFASIGLTRYWDGYFAGRAAPLGAVSAAPVTAIFAGFSPFLVERAVPQVWAVASVESVLGARAEGAAATLRDLVPDEAVIEAAADALAQVVRRVDSAGRPLAAANLALPDESDPYRRLWQSAATLREHRGDGHVIALVTEQIAGLAAIVLRSAVDLDAAVMKTARGWGDEQWDAQADDLVERGLLTAKRTITENGATALNRAEHLTNRLALSPWQGMDDDAVISLARRLEPLARACQNAFPHPDLIGMPQLWDPDDDPSAEAIPELPVAG